MYENDHLHSTKLHHTPYSQMAANLGRARGQTWNRGVLG